MAQSAWAVEPFNRGGKSRLRLSLAAYSFRDFFPGDQARMDMIRFIDFCADHGCAGTELTSYYFPKALSDDYLARVHRHAHLRGIAVSGTAIGNDFCHPPGPKRDDELAQTREWIRRASILGAPHIRVFAGVLHGNTQEEAQKLTIEALEQCAETAAKYGVFLGVENHGGIVRKTDALLEIVKAVKSPWVGINLDTGNLYSDDPYRELEQCAPYAVNVQFKGVIHPAGRKEEPADYARTFKILRDANYQGYVALEYELPEDPWTAVPMMLDKMKPFMD
jgi:sugar phosphate isomerase/epimerase